MRKIILMVLLSTNFLFCGCFTVTSKHASSVPICDPIQIESKWKSDSGEIAVSGYFIKDSERKPVYLYFTAQSRDDLARKERSPRGKELAKYDLEFFLSANFANAQYYELHSELPLDYHKEFDVQCVVQWYTGRDRFRAYNAIWTVPTDLIVAPITYIIFGVGLLFHPYSG